MFATHGYGGTSVRAVVEAVGCTKPAMYYHFGSKAELFVEAVRTVQDTVSRTFADLAGDDADLTVRLERFIDALLLAAVDDPLPTRLILTAAHRPAQDQPELDFQSFHEHNHRLLTEVLRLGQEQGELRTDIPADDLAVLLVGMVHHRALAVLKGLPLPPGVARQLVDVYFNGARP